MFLGFHFNLRDTSELRNDIAALPTHADIAALPTHADIAALPTHADIAALPTHVTLALQNAEIKRQFEHMADLIKDIVDGLKRDARSEPMTQAQARFEKVVEDTCTVPGDEGEVFADSVSHVAKDASIEWCEYGRFEEAHNRGANAEGEPPAHFRPPPDHAQPSPPIPRSELRRRARRSTK
jgi:hypothetical protein